MLKKSRWHRPLELQGLLEVGHRAQGFASQTQDPETVGGVVSQHLGEIHGHCQLRGEKQRSEPILNDHGLRRPSEGSWGSSSQRAEGLRRLKPEPNPLPCFLAPVFFPLPMQLELIQSPVPLGAAPQHHRAEFPVGLSCRDAGRRRSSRTGCFPVVNHRTPGRTRFLPAKAGHRLRCTLDVDVG